MAFLIKTGKIRERSTVLYAGHAVDFVRAWDQFNRLVMVAQVADDHPAMDVFRRHANITIEKIDPGLKFVDAAVIAQASAPAVEAPTLATDDDPNRQRALRMGWSEGDLDGAGAGGDPGPGGGRSATTGLTLAEMALSEPPKDWAELRGNTYPWDAQEWKPPGARWKAPADLVSTKRAEAEAKAAADLEEQGKRAESEDPDGDPGGDPETRGTEDETVPPLEGDALLLAETFGERIGEAIALLQELTKAQKGKKPPSLNKANYHFKKHDLPTPKEDTYAALLRAANLN